MKAAYRARRFVLVRHEDVSGVSGTGVVAEGVEFQNGMCALSFSSPFPHVNTYVNARVMQEVHGHGGATEIVFLDEEEKNG